MIKLYRAAANHGNIKLEDYITFEDGRLSTGIDGFGDIRSSDYYCTKANYAWQSLSAFEDYLKTVKLTDGYVDRFVIWNPMNYSQISLEFKSVPKTFECYEENCLNDEAILLLTDFINLDYDDSLTRYLFGRHEHTGLHLLLPGASINMAIPGKQAENYEVLQSKNLGKQLVLSKMNRKI